MFAEANVIKQGNNYYVKHGDDSGLYVEFTVEAIKNEELSMEHGRPIFEDKDYITIRIAGDTKTVRKRPVQLEWQGDVPPDDKRWPRQYEAFKNQKSQVADGLPLTEWAAITKSDAASMKAMNIHTVEMLAGLQDNHLTWLGARQMRDKAIAWLNQARDGSGLSKLQSENEQLKIQMEALKNQMAGLLDAVPDLEQKKRGRPPKEVNNGKNVTPVDSTSGG